MDLNNKNVIYVGGFGGIGYASCSCFLQNGIANLAIFDLTEDREKLHTLQLINKTANVFYIKLDVTDKQNIEDAFAEAANKMGHFDIVVNGSGIMNERHIERTVQINLLGLIYCTFAAMRYMDASKGGHGGLIVNISSILGLDAYGGTAVYSASKYAVSGFSRALADPFYYETTKIGFITICPSITETPLIDGFKMNTTTTFKQRPPFPQFLNNTQSAELCGKNLIEAVKMAKNGSFWILRDGTLKEYQHPQLDATTQC